MSGRWLSIIGIGEDGRAGLGAAAIALVEGAELIFGGRRHLELFGLTRGEQRVWPTPLDAAIPDILARRGRPVAVLASGDPFWYGAGVTLARAVSADEMLVTPAPSSLSLAAARMGWALQDTAVLGLNMRGLTPLVRRHLHEGRKILALSLNGETPREVAAILTANGFGSSRVTVLEALGGPRERIRACSAATFALDDVGPLNIIAIVVAADPGARPIAFAAGLPDDYFENDGQLTKREIRAITLSSLAPQPGERLWDVGLGAGSVAIEWLLAHAANQAIGVEREAARAARAARNALALGVPQLDVRTGAAPAALSDLPAPDAAFIGGGASDATTIDVCWRALKPGGRIVVNGVTIETEANLIGAHREHGGALTRISIDRADAVGARFAWRPAMPVLQWTAVKPRDAP
ncbi:MAG: precorrin-6y C5,15-methyltransferase (decarboxylating) subunit CbiE [Hyphomicrobium sp.]